MRKAVKPQDNIGSLWLVAILLTSLIVGVFSLATYKFDDRTRAQINDPSSIKLRTITIVPTTSLTPTPTIPITAPPNITPTYAPTGYNIPTPPPQSTPLPATDSPPPYAKLYCVDEEPTSVRIEPCDDATRCDIAHGGGGPSNTCGPVIGWQHTLMESLLQSGQYGANSFAVDLTTDISSNCYIASRISPYISTFNVIDSYNLAGFQGFSRGQHMSASSLENAWKTTPGYTYQTTVQGVTPGYAIFTGSNHVGIVNTVEIDSNGNGHMWFLHTGASYYLGKLIVANWTVVASSTGDTTVRLGGHQSQGADTTQGETICYCESGVCYRYDFITRRRTV